MTLSQHYRSAHWYRNLKSQVACPRKYEGRGWFLDPAHDAVKIASAIGCIIVKGSPDKIARSFLKALRPRERDGQTISTPPLRLALQLHEEGLKVEKVTCFASEILMEYIHKTKTGQWQYRRAVPEKYHDFFGMTEVVRSLRTKDATLAQVQAEELNRDFELQLKAARKAEGLTDQSGFIAPVIELEAKPEQGELLSEESVVEDLTPVPIAQEGQPGVYFVTFANVRKAMKIGRTACFKQRMPGLGRYRVKSIDIDFGEAELKGFLPTESVQLSIYLEAILHDMFSDQIYTDCNSSEIFILEDGDLEKFMQTGKRFTEALPKIKAIITGERDNEVSTRR